MWLLNSGSFGLNVVSKELRLDCDGRTDLFSVICQMCQAQRILHLLIQYHIRFDNGEISWNLGTVNQALTLECDMIKLAAIRNGKLCGYFPLLAFSVLKLSPAFMVAKTQSWMPTVQHRFTGFVFIIAKNIAIIFWIWNIIVYHVIFFAKDIYFLCNLYDIIQTDVNCSVVFLFVL